MPFILVPLVGWINMMAINQVPVNTSVQVNRDNTTFYDGSPGDILEISRIQLSNRIGQDFSTFFILETGRL